MAKLNIKFDASTSSRFPVYSRYPGQCLPQPAFLELDLDTGDLTADYSGEIGNAVPSTVWHGTVLRFKLMPETHRSEIERIIEENKEVFQEILDGSETVWNGSNWVGKHTDEVKHTLEEIDQQQTFVCESEGGMIELENWLDNRYPAENQTIQEFAEEIIDTDGDNGFYFESEPYLDSMLEALENLWLEALTCGDEIPKCVAEFLLDRGNYDDAWKDDLIEFAAQ